MLKLLQKLWFDQQDYELLRIVNDVMSRTQYPEMRRLLASYLHPRGVKELAATKGLRIAYATISLLGSLEAGRARDRIASLRSLREEVLNAAESSLRKNTARVLLQIMKELIRSQEDQEEQLRLAHDFRMALSGKPHFIRAQLQRHHLLEMPEEWNQLAFDDHVHDANTKGRKSPTHLIMDAWIKGIRQLTVIYYNFVRPEVVAELLEAAEIMEISVRVGIEFRARFEDRFAKLIWTPDGFRERQDFLNFLAKPLVAEFMAQGAHVSDYFGEYVLASLRKFNDAHRSTLQETYGVEVPLLDEKEFKAFVGMGQISLMHLGRFIFNKILPAIRKRRDELLAQCGPTEADQREINQEIDKLSRLEPEFIIDMYLETHVNPEIPDPGRVSDSPDTPELLRISVGELVERLNQLHFRNRITANLSHLRPEDVLILLFECHGAITHLEVYNLRNCEQESNCDTLEIVALQTVLNSGNVVRVKRMIRGLIRRLESENGTPENWNKRAKLEEIINDIPMLLAFYKHRQLRSCMGTDSVGESFRRHGMGLVVKDTLPDRAQRRLADRHKDMRRILPIAVAAYPRVSYHAECAPAWINALLRVIRKIPGLQYVGFRARVEWERERYYAARKGPGNVLTLGGVKAPRIEIKHCEAHKSKRFRVHSWNHVNSRFKNGLKILFGFIPAAVSFALTKDWWLLAYFGPFIWFGITGLRNIIQSVLGCGGFHRSPLLRWNDYVSWERFSDSLLYTGFSVPLLDYFVKTLLLDQGLGVTSTTHPITQYSVMALINGIYISSHNTLRGFPRAAIIGNFFRSVLSIPLAVLFNGAVSLLLTHYGVPAPGEVLQKWAAIISKLASDCVAALIEGFADRAKYIQLRRLDFKEKFRHLYDTYSVLEILYPQEDIVELLEAPDAFIATLPKEKRDLEKILIVNALDFLYFWMYQPRARLVLQHLIRAMTQEERKVFLLSQYVLQRTREISQLFIDGLLGRDFAKALAFYLNESQRYLDSIQHIALECPNVEEEQEKGVLL
jgi:hypothetical protein